MCRWYKFTIIMIRWGGNWLHIRDIVSSVHSLWWSGKPRLVRSGKPGILPQLGLEGVEPMAHATCCIQVPCCFISFCSQRPHRLLGMGSPGWPPWLSVSHSSWVLRPFALSYPFNSLVGCTTRDIIGWTNGCMPTAQLMTVGLQGIGWPTSNYSLTLVQNLWSN